MNDRRRGRDRRKRFHSPRFPFQDSNGVIVARDRRSIPDRRLSSIQVNWGVTGNQVANKGR